MDEEKQNANRPKHGISFGTAALVFEDPNRVKFVVWIEGGEERWHAIGSIPGWLLHFTAVHTYANR